jgi:hypothetical protein
MTSTAPEDISSLPDGIKDDELSRRFYLGGFAGLPWLWIVHTLHWYGKQKAGNGARLLLDPNGTSSQASCPVGVSFDVCGVAVGSLFLRPAISFVPTPVPSLNDLVVLVLRSSPLPSLPPIGCFVLG